MNPLKATENLATGIRGWRAGDLYRPAGKAAVVLNLKQNPDGSVLGWAQGSDGRIIGQARWTRATTWGSRMVSSAAVLAGHAMLVEISHKLDRIECKIDRVSRALADDRRQALKAAIDSVNAALDCEQPETSRDLLVATEANIRTSLRKEIQALARFIEDAPTPPRSHAKRFIWDNGAKTRATLAVAEESFLAGLEGIRAVTHLFLALGEYRAAWASADELLDLLAEAGVQEAWWKGRNLRPKNRDDQPEVFWTRAITAIEDARTHTSASNENGPSLSLMLSDSDFELITRDSAVTKDVAAALQ